MQGLSEIRRASEQIDTVHYLTESFITSDFNYQPPPPQTETPKIDYKKELENQKRVEKTISKLKKQGIKC